MLSIDAIQMKLSGWLSEKRYRHSLGVAEEAKRLANRYHADAEKAYLAGLVHDCAKEIPLKEAINLLEITYDIVCDEAQRQTPRILHGPLGACLAEGELGIGDPEILDAICYHTTGKAGMSLLAKIIYIADYIEPNRTYADVELLRAMAYEDIERAILFAVDYTITELVKKKTIIHPDTTNFRNDILIQMSEKERNGDTL